MTGFEIILEVLVVVLLITTIVYAVILNRKLNTVRQGKAEFEALVKDLNVALEQAGQGIGAFRQLSEGNSSRLNEVVKEARELHEDLTFLVERGASIADTLVDSTRERRRSGLMAVAPNEDDDGAGDSGGLADQGELSPKAKENLQKLLSSMR